MDMADIRLPRKMQLSNGVSLYSINEGIRDVVRLDLLFAGGYSVQDMPLQALFTNRMLREGSLNLSATAFSRKLDSCGAWIETYSSQNCNHITLYTLKRHLSVLVKALAEVVKNPSFSEKNLNIVRNTNKAHFLVNSRKVDVVAQRHFERALWGNEHRFGKLVSAEDYDAITVDCLRDYYERVYGSLNCTIFLSGKLDEETENMVASAFGNETWGVSVPIEIIKTPPVNPISGRLNVRVGDTMQSAVKIGTMVMESSHPDFNAFKYMTVLLGGFFGSRLMSNVREQNGYTYHIDAGVSAFGRYNAFVVSSECANEYVSPLIEEVYNEFCRLRCEPVLQTEMDKLRNCTLGELCRECEGALAKADIFINAWLSGDSFDSVNDYLNVIRTATAEDFMTIACKYLLPEKMIEIVAGV